jgi:hypothetical protein
MKSSLASLLKSIALFSMYPISICGYMVWLYLHYSTYHKPESHLFIFA